jgi:MinD-like ATPase involved in chromosome partitioning or flagellar assembly
VSDRDDALRKKPGWAGPEETDYEPAEADPDPTPPATPTATHQPPVDFPATDPAGARDNDAASRPASGPAPDPPSVWRETERAGATVRHPPPRQGPPPGSSRDIGPLPGSWQPARPPRAPNQPPQQHGHAPPQPGQPPQRPGRPPQPGHVPQQPGHWSQPGPWQGGEFGTAARTVPPPSGSFAERIRADDLLPVRQVPPGRGWRRALYRATFGLVNLGQGPDEIRQADLEARIKSMLRGHYKVGVMGKGGVGKTTVSASVGSVFAELRQDDRVVAIDADTAFGKLGSRVDPRAPGSYWELASDQHLETFADLRSRVGNNAAGLFVLAGEATPARRRVLDPAIYREATSRLDRYFTISIVDCSSTMDTPVTQEVLRDLDALIVVSSPWVDGAAAAGQTLDWLAARGLTSLLQRTVIVLNDSDGHADKRTRSILTQQFSSQGQTVIEVPFDGNLRPGGVIAGTTEMAPATRRRFLEIAAALAEHFPTRDDRNRERY